LLPVAITLPEQLATLLREEFADAVRQARNDIHRSDDDDWIPDL
jgi:hypothetical protein